MKIRIDRFRGELPGIDPTLLPDHNASVAFNCRLESGAIKPLRAPKFYRTPTKGGPLQSLYRYNPVPGDMDSGYMFVWPTVVDVVRGPLRENKDNLTYYTGDGYPRITSDDIAVAGSVYPDGSYRLGVPVPLAAPSARVNGSGSSDPEDQRSRDYVVTFLATLGSLVMESAPSPASNIVTVSGSQTVTLSALPDAPTGNYNLTGMRLYRRVTSGQTQQYFRVTDLALNTDSYTDSLSDAQLSSDVLQSALWGVPPEGMHSLGVLGNGFLYGAENSDILVSEAYRPHAWNPFNRVAIGEKVIGTGQLQGAIVAVTHRNPFLISGTNPTSLSAQELEINQGGVSKRSIVSGNYGCAYASPDGLVLLTGSGSGVFTDHMLEREQWQALNPSTLLGAVHDEKYIGFFDNGTEEKSFILDPEQQEKGLIFTDQSATAVHHDGIADSLFIIQDNEIKLWDEGEPLTYKWRSKPYVFTMPVTMTAGRILAEEYSDLTARLWVDGRLRHEQAVTSNQPFRMPSGYAGRVVQMEVQGTSIVRQIEVAESVSELL